MDRTTLIDRIRKLRPELEAEGVAHIAIFGSRARGDNKPSSDVDILVDARSESRFSLLNLIGVEHLVADEIGIKAHATMRRGLDPEFAAEIVPELVEVF